MEKTAKYHTSDNCRKVLYGYRLEAGDILEEGDLYDSTSGEWSPCPCPGLVLGAGSAAAWVRPADE